MKTAQQAMRELREEVAKYQSASEFARAVSVSKAHLSRVLSGQRAIDGRIAKRIGLVRIDAYVATQKARTDK